jgi:hypothetical protein
MENNGDSDDDWAANDVRTMRAGWMKVREDKNDKVCTILPFFD